ncbi:MAG: hypothetical protein AAB426_15260 [Myxococcota bacterium]|mgnify:CR=1 FL=1
MADNLTVHNERQSSPTSAPDAKADKPQDKAALELARLRGIAHTRHHKNLSDEVLLAIAARRKDKLAHEQVLSERKEVFEGGQAKEALVAKSAERATQAQKATGTQDVRGADKLAPEDRQAVRSDPKAGPKLPPTAAKATTSDQAKHLLGAMTALLEVNGEPLDLAAYAASLKQAPPNRAQSSESAKATPKAKESGAKQATLPRTGAKLSLHGGAAPKPQLMGADKSGASGARLAFNARGMTGVADTKVSGDGLINAGGGFVTGWSLDHANINLDAFFTLFLIRTVKDLQYWKRLMRELQSLSRKFQMAAADANMTREILRQRRERMEALGDFATKLWAVRKSAREDIITNAFDYKADAEKGDDGEWKKDASGNLTPIRPYSRADLARVSADVRGKVLPAEADTKDASILDKGLAYGKRIFSMNIATNSVDRATLFQKDIEQRRTYEQLHPDAEVLIGKRIGELEKQKKRVGDELKATSDEKRVRMLQVEQATIEEDIETARQDLIEAPNVKRQHPAAALDGIRNRLLAHDQALYRARGDEALEHKLQQMDLDPNHTRAHLGEEKWGQLQSKWSVLQQRFVERDREVEGKPKSDMDLKKHDEETVKLGGEITRLISDRNTAVGQGIEHMKNEEFGAKLAVAADTSREALFGQDSPLMQAVSNAVAKAHSMASSHEGEVNGQLRSGVSQAQGMINQLLQVQAMSRSR